MNRRPTIAWLALLLTAFVIAAYGTALNMPFIGDDYVYLDRTRDAAFRELWSFNNVDFEWYRPWSRELHFWVLQRVVGLHVVAYRIFGFTLWLTALCLYAIVMRRLASSRVAVLATLGVASLALWGTPLLWISGSQDLWMLCFLMASIVLFVTRHTWWALVPFLLALLSKETSAVLPAILSAYLMILQRRRGLDSLRQTAHFWLLLFAWLAVHPTLHARLLSGGQISRELEHRLPPLTTLARTVLSMLNLDMLPNPKEVGWVNGLGVVVSALVLGVGVAFAIDERPAVDSEQNGHTREWALARFGLAWMAISWVPLFLPSIGWHAYYGCLGALGAWLALAVWLENRRSVAIIVITSLAVLRGALAATPSWDWGNESYQRRAGSILASIRDDLYRQHPTVPPHTRVFLGHIPNNIGLINGQSPALRVWYRDSTLQAGFYSNYRPRPASAPRGADLFFRFDSVAGMVEVRAGPEDVRQGLVSNPRWEGDHEKLAMLFLRNGDVRRAASEFEKLSLLTERPDAAGFAGVCWEVLGDTLRADSLLSEAKSRMPISFAKFQAWVGSLRVSFPGR